MYMIKQGRKCPLDTPERKIERRERERDRLRRKRRVMTETHYDDGNTQ